MTCNHEWGGVVIPGPVNRIVIDQCENCGELRLPDAALPAQAVDLGQQKDAARYHWLRDQYDPSVHDDEDRSFLAMSGEELDAAIDDLIDGHAGREPNSEPNRLTERAESVPVMLKGIGKINGDGWKDTTTIGEIVFVWPTELQKPYAPGQYDRVGNQCGWTASTSQYDFQPATHAEVREFVEAMAAESWERAAELDRLNPDRAVACGQASIFTKDSSNG